MARVPGYQVRVPEVQGSRLPEQAYYNTRMAGYQHRVLGYQCTVTGYQAWIYKTFRVPGYHIRVSEAQGTVLPGYQARAPVVQGTSVQKIYSVHW